MCSGELIIIDLDTGEIMRDGELTITGNNITFTNEQLKVNHRYNVTVRASNSAGSATSYIAISDECTYVHRQIVFHVYSTYP